MALTTTTALCLRKVDFSETSQILTLLSDSLGTVGAIAKGAKRSRSSTGGPLDVMGLYNVVLYDRSKRGTLSILAQAELIDFFPGLRSSYAAFTAVERMCELLLSVDIPPADGAPSLLLAVKGLRSLCDGERPGEVQARFAWALLRLFGLEPVVHHCVVTGAVPSGKVDVAFSTGEMGLLAPPHHEGRTDVLRVTPGTLAVLQALAADAPWDDVSDAALAGAFTLLAWLVALQGGRRLRTVAPLDPAHPL